MNIASWIILAVLAVWVLLAVRNSFFKGKGKKAAPGPDPINVEDDPYKIEMPKCGGCSETSCASCPLARGDIPMPIIHELGKPANGEDSPGDNRNICSEHSPSSVE